MRKLYTTTFLAATVAATLWAAAPDEAGFVAAMKKIGPVCSGLGKKIKAKDASGAADAKELQKLFKTSDKFWKAKKADDAIAHSKTAGVEFGNVHKAIAGGNWEEADATFKKATATCSGCHGAHREKAADGTFKIK
jgi:hypothetical protein